MQTLDVPTARDDQSPAPGLRGEQPAQGRGVDGPAWTSQASGPPPPPPLAPSPDGRGSSGRRSLVAVAMVAALSGAAVATPIALYVDAPDDQDVGASATSADDGAGADAAPPASQVPSSGGGAIDVVAVAEAVGPSVVRIDVSSAAGSGTGSGVVFDDVGHIVTNHHVVGDSSTVSVALPDGRTLDARVIGTDPATDLAVVRVDDADLVPVPIADEPPAIGSAVVAIGSPFGLDGSVTSGIVSALNRDVASSAIPLTGLLQTDAAINPGNSGGALVDADGALVGINTAIASSGGGSDGIGFAIDTATVQSVAADLIADGAVQRSWLGVAGTTTVDDDGQPTGALVQDVLADSPAEAAGLRNGDRIVSLDGEEIPSFPDLAARLVRLDPGDTVTLGIERNGATDDVDVVLGEAA